MQLNSVIVETLKKNRDDAIDADRAVAYAREVATTEEERVKIDRLKRTLLTLE
jgi:hypothetical protein